MNSSSSTAVSSVFVTVWLVVTSVNSSSDAVLFLLFVLFGLLLSDI